MRCRFAVIVPLLEVIVLIGASGCERKAVDVTYGCRSRAQDGNVTAEQHARSLEAVDSVVQHARDRHALAEERLRLLRRAGFSSNSSEVRRARREDHASYGDLMAAECYVIKVP
ncbi:MAG: hypothetical protein ABI625_22495 [bacterium]